MRFLKFWMAVAVTIAQAISSALTDGGITGLEWFVVALAAGNAILVVIVPNLAGSIAEYAKGITASVMAGLVMAQTLFIDGTLDARDWWMIGVAAAGAVGVIAIPNLPKTISSTPRYEGAPRAA